MPPQPQPLSSFLSSVPSSLLRRSARPVIAGLLVVFCASAGFANAAASANASAEEGSLPLEGSLNEQAVESDDTHETDGSNRRSKGRWYGYWGWNRSAYADSDIRFHGDDHDFTLYDVQARDRQTPVTLENIVDRYLNPAQLTIPQYNWRIGYFIADDWSVSLGFDHMKYVMVQDQTVDMTGTIERDGFTDTDAARRDKQLTDDFLTYEHTDGFNLISVETERYFALDDRERFALLAGVGGGLMLPKSNVQLMSGQRSDRWHAAGYGFTAKIGLEAIVWRGLFMRLVTKIGRAEMTDVLTSNQGDRAEQTIDFIEYVMAGGYYF